jgi:uncharacterized protein involved in exopolysaccharide biosynthesis
MTPPAMSFTLRDLAAPLFRRQRVFSITFMFVFAAVALLGLARWQKYEAHMAILVGSERLDPAVTQDVDAEVDLLRSRDLLQQVVLANSLQSGHQFWLNLLHPGQTEVEREERAVLNLASQIELETLAGSNLIEVSYNSTDPALAYGVLNSLSKVLLEKHARAQNDKAAMEDAEAGLRVLAQELVVPAPALSSHRQSNVVSPVAPVKRDPKVADQQLFKKLAINLLDAETRRTQLLLKYETSHPLVKQANQQIAATKEAIAESNRAKDEADLAGQRDTLAADQRSIEKLKAQAGKTRSQALDDAALQREAQVDERNYLQYLAQREQDRVGNTHGKLQITQVTVAIPPARPVLPAHGPLFILFIALASAILVGFPAAYILDYFDPSFHTPAQVTEILRVPIVVAVPKRTA